MSTSRRWFGSFALAAAAALWVTGCGGSSPAQIESTPPAVPVGLNATPASQQVTLTWNANTESDLSDYDVYQGTVSGTLTKVATVAAPSTTHVASGLTNGTTYYFAITARDTNGNASARCDEVSATPVAPDTTPPTASLSLPAAGATGVAVSTSITVAFSEDMAPATVTVSLTPPPPAPAELGPPEWVDGKTVAFHPTGDLEFNTTYTVAVEGEDLAGNPLAGTKSFIFTTANPPDTTAPTILATGPADGATGVGVSTSITFQFSEPMSAASVHGAFSVAQGPAISCAWIDSADLTTFTCTHADLAFGTTYKLNVGAGATDTAGNPFVPPASPAVVLTFTTASAPDTVQPKACPATGGSAPCPATSSTSPAAGATGVARATGIVVQFSEPMNQASAQAAFAITSPTGHSTGVFSWNAAGDQMTFNPDTDFAYGDNVTWRVATGATDIAGNALEAQYTSTFRAIRQATVSFWSTPALDGYVYNTGSVYAAFTYCAIGDVASNAYPRGFLSFDLSSIPATFTLTSATLYAYQSSVTSTPYADLGGLLRAESVNYGTSLEASDFETTVLQTLQCPPCPIGRICRCLPWDLVLRDEVVTLSSTVDVGWKSVGVLRKVNDDLSSSNRTARGSRSQFRLRFPTNTDSDGVADYALILSGEAGNNGSSGDLRARLDLVYEYP